MLQSCGTPRSLIVPLQFANFVSRLVSEALPTEETPAESSNMGPPSHRQSTSLENPAVPTSREARQPSTWKGANTYSPMSSNHEAIISIDSGYQRALHVGLVVFSGGTYKLSQIEIKTQQNLRYELTDTSFFQLLRLKYQKLRGFLLTWFSIWIYSHCDFYMARIHKRPGYVNLSLTNL